MVIVFSTTPGIAAALQEAILHPSVHVRHWADVGRLSARADLVLVELAAVEAAFQEEFFAFTRDPLTPPVAGVVRDSVLPYLDLIAAGSFLDLLSVGERTRLAAIVRRLEARNYLARLAEDIRTSELFPLRLRRAIIAALVSRPPFRTVEELADAAGCHVSTLHREWRTAMDRKGSHHPVTAKGFLDRVILVRAAASRRGRSWEGTARELAVPLRTLQRVTRRILDVPLSSLEGQGSRQVVHELEEVLRTVSGG